MAVSKEDKLAKDMVAELDAYISRRVPELFAIEYSEKAKQYTVSGKFIIQQLHNVFDSFAKPDANMKTIMKSARDDIAEVKNYVRGVSTNIEKMIKLARILQTADVIHRENVLGEGEEEGESGLMSMLKSFSHTVKSTRSLVDDVNLTAKERNEALRKLSDLVGGLEYLKGDLIKGQEFQVRHEPLWVGAADELIQFVNAFKKMMMIKGGPFESFAKSIRGIKRTKLPPGKIQ